MSLFPTPTDILPPIMEKRQQIVTEMVTASASATAAAEKKKPFPVTVAVPALVGGMALAIALFLLAWWIAKRRRREKRVSFGNFSC